MELVVKFKVLCGSVWPTDVPQTAGSGQQALFLCNLKGEAVSTVAWSLPERSSKDKAGARTVYGLTVNHLMPKRSI